jgi:hypothetical protein
VSCNIESYSEVTLLRVPIRVVDAEALKRFYPNLTLDEAVSQVILKHCVPQPKPEQV